MKFHLDTAKIYIPDSEPVEQAVHLFIADGF